MVVVGIDPGKKGALVALESRSLRPLLARLTADLCPGKGYAAILLARLVAGLRADYRGVPMFCAIEQQQARGRVPISSSAVLTTGRGWGLWEGVIAANEIPVQNVSAQKWTAAMGCRGDKGAHITRCLELIPGLDLTPGRKRKPQDGLADAALIALYAIRNLIGPDANTSR